MKRGPLTGFVGFAAWIVSTIAISAFTASIVAPDDGGEGAQPTDITAVDAEQRATVTVARHVIQPVVSLDGTVVASEDGSGFDLSAPVTQADAAYRLIDAPNEILAAIGGGPAGFPCAFKRLGADQGGVGTSVVCEVPDNIRVVAGLSATLVIALERSSEVDALPRSAVIGDADHGLVVVVENDGLRRQTVALGAADSNWVQIRSGLAKSDRVLARPVEGDLQP